MVQTYEVEEFSDFRSIHYDELQKKAGSLKSYDDLVNWTKANQHSLHIYSLNEFFENRVDKIKKLI